MLEQQTTQDIIHLAMRRAESRVARRVGQPVRIATHGAVWLASNELITTWAGLDSALVGVRQRTGRRLPGTAHLVLPASSARALIRELRGHASRRGELNALERSALRELGSVLLNAVVAGLATTTGHDVGTSLPALFTGDAAQLAPPPGTQALVTLCRVHLRGVALAEGYLAWALEPEVSDCLRGRLVGSLAANLVAAAAVGGSV